MKEEIDELINTYNSVVKVVDTDAKSEDDRAYGGVVRSVKGKLQEHLTEEIIKLAWKKIGGNLSRMRINSQKHKILIKKEYIKKIKDDQIRKYVKDNISDYYYNLSVDKQIFIDNQFVSGIECKSYTENAMLKRILVDFSLLKTVFPSISCYLFQLESQLGGDYSELNTITFGSKPTHTLMSYFPEVELNIFTFLQGERKINRPIHKHKFYKHLDKKRIQLAIDFIATDLSQYLPKEI